MTLFRLPDIQTRLLQLPVVLEERGEVVFHPYPHIPIIEVVVQYGHLDGDGAVQMVCRDDGNMREAFGTLLPDLLLIHLHSGFRLLQQDMVGLGHLLPVLFREGQNPLFQQGGIGTYLHLLRQMQGCHQLMIGNLARITDSRQLQTQLLLLQFIARDVVFQDSALLPAGVHVGYDFLGQLQVLSQHPDLIVQLIQVQVMPCQQEAYLLHILPQVQLGQQLPQFRLPDAAAYGAARIDDLLRLQGEVVAEMRHVYHPCMAEIPVPQLAVTPIAGGKGHVHVRKPLCLGRFEGLVGSFGSCPVGLDTLTLFIGQAEQFFQSHRPGLGTQALAA